MILEAPGSISEAPSLDFGGSELDFWGVQTSVSKVLGVIFGTANAKNAQKSAKTKTPSRGAWSGFALSMRKALSTNMLSVGKTMGPDEQK